MKLIRRLLRPLWRKPHGHGPDSVPAYGRLTAGESGRAAQAYVRAAIVARGWVVLAENLRDRRGELDIVAECKSGTGDVVVIEVRSYSTSRGAKPTDILPKSKQLQVTETARRLLPRQPWWRKGLNLRFDAAIVGLDRDGRPKSIEYLPHAFEARRRDWM